MKHTITHQAIVPYQPEQMYNLVNRIEDYPLFVPYCTAGQIISHHDNVIIGSLQLSAKGIRQSFTTRNVLNPTHSIQLTLVDGPFKSLKGLWQFKALENGLGCEVSLRLEFQLANTWLSKLFGLFFTQVANKLVEAFCHRADTVYAS